MKMRLFFTVALALCSLFCSSCQKHSNGWYFLTEEETLPFDKPPIVTSADFETLQLDSSYNSTNGITRYQIEGQLKTDKIETWKNATTKAIGNKIGFLYNGEIIAAPQVNQTIESGRFAISSAELSKDGTKMLEIFENLRREMK